MNVGHIKIFDFFLQFHSDSISFPSNFYSNDENMYYIYTQYNAKCDLFWIFISIYYSRSYLFLRRTLYHIFCGDAEYTNEVKLMFFQRFNYILTKLHHQMGKFLCNKCYRGSGIDKSSASWDKTVYWITQTHIKKVGTHTHLHTHTFEQKYT